MRIVLWIGALVLAGCARRVETGPLPPRAEDPAALLALAQGDRWPGPLVGSFSGTVTSGDRTFPVRGELLVGSPRDVRVEVRGPIGGAAIVATTDGRTASVWVASGNTTWTLPAGELPMPATAEAVVALALGRVPALAGAPAIATDATPPRYTWTYGQAALDVTLDPGTARIARGTLRAPGGVSLLAVDAAAGGAPAYLPRELALRVGDEATPRAQATLRIEDWSPATPDPSAFTFTPPPGSTVRVVPGLEPAP
jgi:hypothetical protein